MLFSSLTFLYGFLPVVLAVYFLVPARKTGARNAVLLVASLVFYALGGPTYVAVMAAQILIAWAGALGIEVWRGTARARAVFVLALVTTLSTLLFFKYADFFIANLDAWTGADVPLLRVVLPLGISFYTFQTMSYLVDVWRKDAETQRNVATLATYVALFPQLIAGPIVRYGQIATELDSRTSTLADISWGLRRFVIGLAKKVLLANTFGALAESLKSGAVESAFSALGAWLWVVAFALQIYFDFSGYSDMAVGLGRVFGFRFPENFNYPYISRTITEFWRRWHMTLSSWFRDYVYFPLGGSRVPIPRTILNLAIVWTLTGFWHGAQWNFVAWGAYFAVVLIAEKLLVRRVLEKLPGWVGHVYALVIVSVSWVLFDASSMGEAMAVLGSLAGLHGGSDALAMYLLKSYAVPLVIGVIGATPLPATVGRWCGQHAPRVMAVMEPALVAAALVLVTAFLVDGSFNPFIYFRF